MSRIKVGVGALLVILALFITERSDVLLIYGICAVLHEAGHLIAARVRGIKVNEIRLDVSGVRICTEDGIGSYADEFILCMSGPLVNISIISIGALAFAIMDLSPDSIALSLQAFVAGEADSYVGAAAFFVLCAVLQGGLNLLPIKTFDGGRMLYCACAATLGQGAAERIVGLTSALCIATIWSAALYLMIRMDAGLSIYTFAACIFLGTLRDKELIE